MRAVRVIVHIVFSSLVHIVQFHSITFTSRARARVPIVTQAGHGRARVISVCLPPARARAGLPSICCFSRTRKLPPPVASKRVTFFPNCIQDARESFFPSSSRQNAYECFTQFAARSRKNFSFRKRIARLRECRAAARPDAGYTQPSYRLR